jgi:hypothetical protein
VLDGLDGAAQVAGSLPHEQDVANAGAVQGGLQPLGTVLRCADGVDGQQVLDVGIRVAAGVGGLEGDVLTGACSIHAGMVGRNSPRAPARESAMWHTAAAMCSARSGSCPCRTATLA